MYILCFLYSGFKDIAYRTDANSVIKNVI